MKIEEKIDTLEYIVQYYKNTHKINVSFGIYYGDQIKTDNGKAYYEPLYKVGYSDHNFIFNNFDEMYNWLFCLYRVHTKWEKVK